MDPLEGEKVTDKLKNNGAETDLSQNEIRLNLGCGGRPLPGYINIDMDTLEELKVRYPTEKFPEGIEVYQYDIFNLPFSDDSVAEIRADSLLEHLSFLEERKLFYEVKRVLRPGGIFVFSVPDFEDTVELWLKAKDDWKDFFRNDPEAIAQQHWFGQYSYSTENRWGYLTASIFGPQNSEGQFHKNCYTVPKIRAILHRLDFEEPEISNYRWKNDRNLMILVKVRKKA
jgi:predicted SAM-dependent methyltransferase